MPRYLFFHRRWLGLLVFLLTLAGPSAGAPRADSLSPPTVRSFSSQALAHYRADPAFRYGEDPAPSGWWARGWRWVRQQIGTLFQHVTQTTAGRVVLALCMALLVAFLVLRAAGLEGSGWFGRRDPGVGGRADATSTGSVDFDPLIRQAADGGDYRQALRLWYLKTLQLLAARQYIQWKPGKTNASYVTELRGKPWDGLFTALTRDFEYCWYGEGTLDAEAYRHVAERFAGLHQQIS